MQQIIERLAYALCAGPLKHPEPHVASPTVFHLCDKQSRLGYIMTCVEMLLVNFALEQRMFIMYIRLWK
jgi:hypothetical protein